MLPRHGLKAGDAAESGQREQTWVGEANASADHRQLQHYVNQKENATEFMYQWKAQNKWQTIVVETQKNEIPIEVDSEAEFITEHYFGYTKVNAATTYEYEVKHPRWNQLNVTDFRIHVDFERVYGSKFGFLNHQQPTSVLLAVGSEVRVENKKKL